MTRRRLPGGQRHATFAAGETTKTFSVTILPDGADETRRDETVNLTVSAPGGGGALGNPGTATLCIVVDD